MSADISDCTAAEAPLPHARVCLGSFGVCTAQTSQAAGLGSVSHRSIFQSSG